MVLAELVLVRPWALLALGLPVLYLWLVLLARRPDPIVIGTFAWWKELPRPVANEGARRRGRWTPSTWLTAAALLLGALAWGGPRSRQVDRARRWTCVVDTSSSMGLEAQGATRGALALEAASEWLRSHAGARDQVLWRTPGRDALLLARAERPSERWLAARRGAGGTPDWAAFDAPGTLWITDRAPPLERRAAGLFASGGEAVPGRVAADGREEVLWDGERLERRAASRRPTLYLRPPAAGMVPEVLLRFADAWCGARGFVRVESPIDEVALVLDFAGAGSAGEAIDVSLARDGWSASGRALLPGSRALGPEAETWLLARVDARDVPIVLRAPGRITVLLAELSEPAGDPVLFALSWGRLFDEAALAPQDVVALEERLAAGEAVRSAPLPGLPASDGEDAGRPARAPSSALEAGLALAAAVLGAVGLLATRRT